MTKLHTFMLATLAVLYIVMGGVILSARNFWDLPFAIQLAFGVLCIVYGCYRLYRAYVRYKEQNDAR